MQIVSTLVNQPQYIGELVMGDKRMIQAGRNYHEGVVGNVQVTTGVSKSPQGGKDEEHL